MIIEQIAGGKFGVHRELVLVLLLRYEMDWKRGTLVDANGLFLDTALPWIRDAGADGVALCWSDFTEMHSFTIEDAGIALAMLHRAFPRGEGEWLAAVNGSWIAFSTAGDEYAVLRLFAQPASAHLP